MPFSKFFLSAALAASVTPALAQNAAQLPTLGINVQFRSHGAGIDTEGYGFVKKLERQAKQSGALIRSTELRWGEEGEVTLCMQFRDVPAASNFNAWIRWALAHDNARNRRTAIISVPSCPAHPTRLFGDSATERL